jgi:hypothetical protein
MGGPSLPIHNLLSNQYERLSVLLSLTEQSARPVFVQAAEHGVRSAVMRLALHVYGRNGSTFVPIQIAKAQEDGVARYIGDG